MTPSDTIKTEQPIGAIAALDAASDVFAALESEETANLADFFQAKASALLAEAFDTAGLEGGDYTAAPAVVAFYARSAELTAEALHKASGMTRAQLHAEYARRIREAGTID